MASDMKTDLGVIGVDGDIQCQECVPLEGNELVPALELLYLVAELLIEKCVHGVKWLSRSALLNSTIESIRCI